MGRRTYNLKVPRFDPYKNIYVDVDCIKKICTKTGERIPLNYENWAKDTKREYGYKSQSRKAMREYNNEYSRQNTIEKNERKLRGAE